MPKKSEKKRRRDELCEYPGCELVAYAWVANNESLISPDYREAKSCRWHLKTIFGMSGAGRDDGGGTTKE